MLNIKHRQVKNKGFTLIEMLVAISIFASLSLAAYQVLQGVIRSADISKIHTAQLKKLQHAMLIMEQDFTQISARNTRDDDADKDYKGIIKSAKYLFSSEDQGIEFTRLGWSNPLGRLPRSNLLRVRYRLFDGQLQRLYFLYPDAIVGEEPQMQVLLKNIDSLEFRFWNSQWQSTWRSKTALPEGVEISFKSARYGSIVRKFLIPSVVIYK
ncbi:type II secretory pathway protein [Psychromonas sp. PRT-SC03]|nr:type II secretory pathway protein [Psychromonas sp. PRT-SC03]